MRVSSFSNVPFIPPIAPQAVPPQTPCAPPAPAAFLPFSAQAFDQARLRDVPVLLFICDAPPSFADAALNMQIFERTVPVWLYPGMRPDVELLCQRAGALFSGEGALPLCALMLEDARVFLAAPLPPAGFALDPSRLYVWLSQADRRFAQNRDAFIRQAAQTVRSFRAEPLRKPYSPGDAAHDLTRALLAVRDPINGGFGKLKQPLCPALRFLSRAALRDRQAHAALDQTLDAMLASDLYDPLDGAFFRATLTEDWRAFVPEKPLAINALLALTLLESGRRAEAVRTLDFLLSACFAPGGALNPCLTYDRESCTFTPEQVCAAEGIPGDNLRDLHDLFLIDDNPVGVFQAAFQRRQRIGDVHFSVLALDEFIDHAGTERAGPVQRQHSDDVFKAVRAEHTQVLAHTRAFHLKHAVRIAPGKDIVGIGVRQRKDVKVGSLLSLFFNGFQGVVDQGHGPQTKEVELHEPHFLDHFHIELGDKFAFFPPIDRQVFIHRLVGNHHTRSVRRCVT